MNRSISKHCLRPIASLAFLAVALVSSPTQADEQAAKVERGKYLVSTSACNDCHTPWKVGPAGPEPDMSRMLSGHPADFAITAPAQLSGPWLMAAAPTNTAWSGPLGCQLHGQPHARQGNRARQMDRSNVHSDHSHRPSHGPRPHGAAPDAHPGLQQLHRRGPRRDLHLSAEHSRDTKSRAGTPAARDRSPGAVSSPIVRHGAFIEASLFRSPRDLSVARAGLDLRTFLGGRSASLLRFSSIQNKIENYDIAARADHERQVTDQRSNRSVGHRRCGPVGRVSEVRSGRCRRYG